MRNLTKVLALVLSLAFVMTMFAGAVTPVAKYSDAATTTAGDEAVTVLRALGIVDGYPDGSYGYEKNVTRAEYAKLIAIAANGEDTTPFYNTEAVSFKDTVDAWAKPYVNYCYLTGILAGYTDGTVKAANPVKGVEAIKMTLVALGYNPETEGLVGANWINNTVTLAQRAGLLVNLEGENLYAAFDREAIAILVYNALYADTVEYIGNTAVATEYTLGEDAFDLLDVRAIVVATDDASIDVTYKSVLDTDNKYATESTINYKTAKANTSTVVYLDYTGAATVGGYYTPRAITLAEDFSKNELGKTYRVLTTGCKTPYNTTEIRKVYGVIEIADNGYTETYVAAIVDSNGNNNLYNKVNGMKDGDRFFIDGGLTNKDAMLNWVNANKCVNAPVIYTDYNNDGQWDTVKVFARDYWEVVDVTETKYFIKGGVDNAVKALTIADYPSLELVKGDWVSKDGLDGYQKLSTVSGMVNAISSSSVTIDGITVGGTTAAVANSISSIVNALGGAPGVNATIWYDADGKKLAVDGELTDAASWQNYGIVTGWSDDVLGMRTVRIFTADNTYETYVVTAVNGNKSYDQYLKSGEIAVNDMVKYYVDGNTVALYTWDRTDLLMIGEAYTTSLAYNGKYDVWMEGTTEYTWNNAVIFATNKKSADYTSNLNNENDWQWRAYTHDTFQPVGGFTAPGAAKAIVNKMSSYVKVAAVELDYLPGLVLGNDQWLTLTKAPKLIYTATEDGVVTYTYELTYVVPNGQPNTTTTANIKSNLPLDLSKVKDGSILRATFNEEGEVIYWVDALNGEVDYDGNGLEMAKLTLDFAREDAKGVVDVVVKDINLFTKNDAIIAENYKWFTLADECDFYLVKNIGGDCSVNDSVADYYGTWIDVLNRAAAKGYAVYADINWATREINSIWIDTAMQTKSVEIDGIATLVEYNEVTREAKWELTARYGFATYIDTLVEKRDPETLPCVVGADTGIKVTLTIDVNDVVTATFPTAIEKAGKEITTASVANDTQRVVWDGATVTIYGDEKFNESVTYTFDSYAQIWWERTNYNTRLNAIGGVVATETDSFYKTATQALSDLANEEPMVQNFGTTKANTALNYEEIILVDTDGNGQPNIMVLVDTSEYNKDDASMVNFPYSAN